MSDKKTTPEVEARYAAALTIVKNAAQTALELFNQRDDLVIESKGLQDWVSNADRDVETEIRNALAKQFSDDTIVGEEHDNIVGSSAYTWIIDPIDGTASFVSGIPGWCVVLACVRDNEPVIGVIVDPNTNECFSGCEGGLATLNDKPLKASKATSLTEGSVAVGYCARHNPKDTLALLQNLMTEGGIYYRCGSGALMLSYVAAGRLIGYVEPHMYAWDCVAGLFLIEQAGGKVQSYDMETMISSGGPILAGGAGVYDKLAKLG